MQYAWAVLGKTLCARELMEVCQGKLPIARLFILFSPKTNLF